ncbi:MAG: hypothetical protein ABIP71_08580 [Verrucomicrobiota bacterium]
MRLIKLAVILALAFALNNSTHAASPSIKKVLPQFIDAKGRNSLSPSLYERDAYQLLLRNHPEQRSGLRFAILWSAPRGKALVLRVELRGAKGDNLDTIKLDASVKKMGWFSRWSSLELRGEDYQKFGDLVAWRATLWDGEKQMAQQQSFLW